MESAQNAVHAVADVETELVVVLKRATVRLRDAELELRAAQAGYKEALQAFNAHVAPVKP